MVGSVQSMSQNQALARRTATGDRRGNERDRPTPGRGVSSPVQLRGRRFLSSDEPTVCRGATLATNRPRPLPIDPGPRTQPQDCWRERERERERRRGSARGDRLLAGADSSPTVPTHRGVGVFYSPFFSIAAVNDFTRALALWRGRLPLPRPASRQAKLSRSRRAHQPHRASRQARRHGALCHYSHRHRRPARGYSGSEASRRGHSWPAGRPCSRRRPPTAGPRARPGGMPPPAGAMPSPRDVPAPRTRTRRGQYCTQEAGRAAEAMASVPVRASI